MASMAQRADRPLILSRGIHPNDVDSKEGVHLHHTCTALGALGETRWRSPHFVRVHSHTTL